jgi:hypothetical protein
MRMFVRLQTKLVRRDLMPFMTCPVVVALSIHGAQGPFAKCPLCNVLLRASVHAGLQNVLWVALLTNFISPFGQPSVQPFVQPPLYGPSYHPLSESSIRDIGQRLPDCSRDPEGLYIKSIRLCSCLTVPLPIILSSIPEATMSRTSGLTTGKRLAPPL